MIKEFADRMTAQVFDRQHVRQLPPDIQRRAERKLRLLHRARSLDDLRAPPGNQLEALRGDRAGQHSIRINDQWRIVFQWRDGHTYGVMIVDYH